MWDMTSFKLRSFVRKKKKANTHLHFTHQGPIHIKRTQAEVMVANSRPLEEPQIIPSRVVLNDMTPERLYLYTSVPIELGQYVQFTMEKPKRLFAHGKVISCQNVAMNLRIISQHQFPYRVKIEFEFQSNEDRENIKKYCEETIARCLADVA